MPDRILYFPAYKTHVFLILLLKQWILCTNTEILNFLISIKFPSSLLHIALLHYDVQQHSSYVKFSDSVNEYFTVHVFIHFSACTFSFNKLNIFSIILLLLFQFHYTIITINEINTVVINDLDRMSHLSGDVIFSLSIGDDQMSSWSADSSYLCHKPQIVAYTVLQSELICNMILKRILFVFQFTSHNLCTENSSDDASVYIHWKCLH